MRRRRLRSGETERSFQIGDIAANGGCGCDWDGLASDCGVENVLQFVCGRGRAGAPGDFVQIVDAAVIEQASLGVEDGNFGSDGGACLFDQRMRRIAKSRDRNGELAQVFVYLLSGSVLFRIYEPEIGVFRLDAFYLQYQLELAFGNG